MKTICNNQQPGTYLGTIATGGNKYCRKLCLSVDVLPDKSVFTPVPIAGTGVNYSPLQLTATTISKAGDFRSCVANSNSITETVLPL